MAEFPSDYLPPTLDDLLTAADVAALRPPSGLWGYNIQVTDEALGRIAQVVTERDVEIAVLRQQLAELRARNGPAQRAGGGRYPVIPPRVAAVERDAAPVASQDPSVTAVVPAEPEVVPAEAVPAEPEVVPALPVVPAEPVPAGSEAVPAEAAVVPAEAEAVPAEAEAVPDDPEASPAPDGPEAELAEAAVAGPAAAPAEAVPAEAVPAEAVPAEAVPAEAEAEVGGEPAAVHGAARRDE